MTPGTSSMMPFQLFAAGVFATSSPLRICWRAAFCTSTIGVSPVTVIVSASVPTFKSALMVHRARAGELDRFPLDDAEAGQR